MARAGSCTGVGGCQKNSNPTGMMLPVSYWLTDPAENVNWVHGLGREQRSMSPGVYLALLTVSFWLVLYLPPHLMLRALFAG